MIEIKLAQKFGNSAHVVLPKEYVGKRIRFISEPKSFEDIKAEVLKILQPYLEHVIGIYLYGSYARNEQDIKSDIDILVVTSDKIKIISRYDDFTIVSATTGEIEHLLNCNPILILPILKECKTIINPELLEKYKNNKFTKKNSKEFIDNTKKILELDKKGLELNFDIGSLIYSLILRIRSLLIIYLDLNNKLYARYLLFRYLKINGLSKEKINELYSIYVNERKGIQIKESRMINKKDLVILLNISNNLLKDIKRLLK